MSVDLFSSVRDGYTLETITFNFDELVNAETLIPSSGQLGITVKARCPHDEPFGAFISLSKEALNDEPNVFSELVRMVDSGAETVMENGCDNHNKKGNS